jgi:hypothetical protein
MLRRILLRWGSHFRNSEFGIVFGEDVERGKLGYTPFVMGLNYDGGL